MFLYRKKPESTDQRVFRRTPSPLVSRAACDSPDGHHVGAVVPGEGLKVRARGVSRVAPARRPPPSRSLLLDGTAASRVTAHTAHRSPVPHQFMQRARERIRSRRPRRTRRRRRSEEGGGALGRASRGSGGANVMTRRRKEGFSERPSPRPEPRRSARDREPPVVSGGDVRAALVLCARRVGARVSGDTTKPRRLRRGPRERERRARRRRRAPIETTTPPTPRWRRRWAWRRRNRSRNVRS